MTHFWDTLQLTVYTDEEKQGCVRVMYDKDELDPGYNLMRERRFNHDAIYFPEVVVVNSSNIELEFKIYYQGEEEFEKVFLLNFDNNPQLAIKIGTDEKSAVLELLLLNFDEIQDDDDEIDDDGRYDAWA